MHEGVESNWRADYPLEDKVRSTAAGRLALPIRVYDLRDDGSNSDEFYSKIAEFAARIVARIEERIGPILVLCPRNRLHNNPAGDSLGYGDWASLTCSEVEC